MKPLPVPLTAGRVPLSLIMPVGRGAGTVVTRVKVRVMRVGRVLMNDEVSGSVLMMAGEVVAGGSECIVTVAVPMTSEDGLVWRGTLADSDDAADGAGERTGPTGPAGLGELVLVGSAGSLSRYPAKNFSISDRRCSRAVMMARRSSGRSFRPDWILQMSSRTASAAVEEGEGAKRVELRICWGSFTATADEVVSDRGEYL
jgi:hypothetical protein